MTLLATIYTYYIALSVRSIWPHPSPFSFLSVPTFCAENLTVLATANKAINNTLSSAFMLAKAIKPAGQPYFVSICSTRRNTYIPPKLRGRKLVQAYLCALATFVWATTHKHSYFVSFVLSLVLSVSGSGLANPACPSVSLRSQRHAPPPSIHQPGLASFPPPFLLPCLLPSEREGGGSSPFAYTIRGCPGQTDGSLVPFRSIPLSLTPLHSASQSGTASPSEREPNARPPIHTFLSVCPIFSQRDWSAELSSAARQA